MNIHLTLLTDGLKLVDSGLSVSLSWIQACRRELRMVGRVGEVLHLQAETVVLSVSPAIMSREVVHVRVGDVELHARFGGVCFQHPAGYGVGNNGSQFEGRRAGRLPQFVVDVVAFAHAVHSRLCRQGRSEVIFGSCHGEEFTGGNADGIVPGDGICPKHIGVLQYGGGTARQIEVAVVGQVDHCGAVRYGGVFYYNFIPVSQLVSDGDIQIAGKTSFLMGTSVLEDNGCRVLLRVECVCVEQLEVESPATSVDGMLFIVLLQLIGRAVEAEAGIPDAVGIAAYGRAQFGMSPQVALYAVEAQHDMSELSMSVGHGNIGQRGGIVRHFDCHAVPVHQPEKVDGTVFFPHAILLGYRQPVAVRLSA